jgi:hypothetical protein
MAAENYVDESVSDEPQQVGYFRDHVVEADQILALCTEIGGLHRDIGQSQEGRESFDLTRQAAQVIGSAKRFDRITAYSSNPCSFRPISDGSHCPPIDTVFLFRDPREVPRTASFAGPSFRFLTNF